MTDRSPVPSLDPSAPDEFAEETSMQKFKRRLREEPLIPLGCFATCYALYRAYRSMKVKDSAELNRMFRARIYAQFFTLCAVVAGGMYYKTDRQRRREFERMVEERKAQEKRDAWLRELETRDQEDQGWRERHAAVGESAAKVGKQTTTTKADENRAVVEEADRKGESSLGIVDAVRRLVEGRRN